MHLAIELPWSDNGWEGRVCDDPEMNGSCRAWKNARDGIDLQLEQGMRGEAWKLTKDRPGGNRNYRLPCWSFVNTFGPRPVPFIPRVHRNIGRGKAAVKFQRVRGYTLPPYSTACAPWLQMLKRDTSDGKWLDNPADEAERLQQFWSQFRSDYDLVFFFCRKGHPHESSVGILPVGVCLLRAIYKIGQGIHPSSRAKDPFPLWEHAVTHGFPSQGFRVPWQEMDQDSTAQALAALQGSSQWVIPIQHPVVAMSSVEMLPWIGRLLSVSQCALPLAKRGNADWLAATHEIVRNDRESYPSLGAVLDALTVPEPFEKAVLAEQDRKECSSDPWDGLTNQVLPRASQCVYRANLKRALGIGDSSTDRRLNLGILLSQLLLPDDQVWRLLHNDDNLPDRLARLRENPYWLCDPKTARSWGLKEPVAPAAIDVVRDDRVKGQHATNWVGLDSASVFGRALATLNQAAKVGNSCLPLEHVVPLHNERGLLLRMTSVLHPDISPMIFRRSAQEIEMVALRAEHDVEIELAQTLFNLANTKAALRIGSGGEVKTIMLDDWALDARGVAVITGPAGTGKSHAVRALYAQLQSRGVTPAVVTPTGRAAKLLREVRVGDASVADAQTLHSFLAEKGWYRSERFQQTGAPFRVECMIIDEASMLSNEQLLTLLRATGTQLKFLCLVGDREQLEPIGVGRPFSVICDWVAAHHGHRCRQLANTHPERSGANNPIAAVTRGVASSEDVKELSRCLNSSESTTRLGKSVEVRRWSNHDELRLAVGDAMHFEAARSKLSRMMPRSGSAPLFPIANDLLWPQWRDDECSIFSWQILCPRRASIGGIDALNILAQKMLFTDDHLARLRRHHSRFYLGRVNREDKVMWTVNDYLPRQDHGGVKLRHGQVVNGALGVVFSPKGVSDKGLLFVQSSDCFYGFAAVPRDKIGDYLELGYATTVHKAQGSGFQTVILVLDSFDHATARRLLYTATTRHKNRLFILLRVPPDGSNPAGALKPLLENPAAFPEDVRQTLLGDLLEELGSAHKLFEPR